MITKKQRNNMLEVLDELQQLQKQCFGVEDFMFQIDTANFKDTDGWAIFVHAGLSQGRNFYDFYSFDNRKGLALKLQQVKGTVEAYTGK